MYGFVAFELAAGALASIVAHSCSAADDVAEAGDVVVVECCSDSWVGEEVRAYAGGVVDAVDGEDDVGCCCHNDEIADDLVDGCGGYLT